MPTLSLKDITLYYESHGQGEPLVLIAGVGTDSQSWASQLPDFTKSFRVVVFDNRGIGRTDKPAGAYSVDQMAQDAVNLMHVLDIPQAHILGHSLGGLIAQQLALKHPSSVKSLMLCSTSAKVPAITNFVLQNWLVSLQNDIPLNLYMRNVLPWIFSSDFFENQSKVENFLTLCTENPFPLTATGIEGQTAAVATYDAREEVHKITIPTLVLAARHDILLPCSASLELHQKIPHSHMHIMETGGHACLIEQPLLYNKCVLQFLKNL